MDNNVGSKIAEKGYLKGYVARKAKISPGALSKIISGETKDPKTSVALRIAKVLESTVEELWGHLVNETD